LVEQSFSSKTDTVSQASLRALGRIACVSVQYRDKVLEAGAKRAFKIQLLDRCNDWDSLLMSASTLAMFCEGAPPPDEIVLGFCLAELHTFLDPTLEARQMSNGRPSAPVDIPPCCDKMLSICCSTLVHLCGGPIDLIEVMNEKGIFDHLLSLLNHNSDVVNRLVLKAIGRLVIRDKPFILPIINGGILRRLMFFLQPQQPNLPQEDNNNNAAAAALAEEDADRVNNDEEEDVDEDDNHSDEEEEDDDEEEEEDIEEEEEVEDEIDDYSKDGDDERYGVNIRQDACQILSIVVMCDNKGLKILALSIDDSALVLLCALVTIDTASTLYGLKALKKVSNCTIY